MFAIISRLLFAVDHAGPAHWHREENLREQRDRQYELMRSTDPNVRKNALDEIDRINCMLRAT